MTRWFEDVAVDMPFTLGAHTFTAEEMTGFARQYDPTVIGADGTVPHASGWQVVATGHRKMVERLEAEVEVVRAEGGTPGVSGPSPGVNTINFGAAVAAGDTVSFSLVVTAKRRSNSIAGWGLLFNRIDATNQRGEMVYTAEVVGFSKLRDYRMPLGTRLAAMAGAVVKSLRKP